MSADERTLAFYNTDAGAYAAASHQARWLEDFVAELPRGGSALDLGCGAGMDSAMLRDAGFRVTSVDASTGLAAEAKRLWNIDVRALRFDELDYIDTFDGVWASASLHHARVEDLPGVFAAIRRAVKVGGVLHASLKEGVDRRDGRDRFFCAMSEDALRALAADWRDVRIQRSEVPGYDGPNTPWLTLRAVR